MFGWGHEKKQHRNLPSNFAPLNTTPMLLCLPLVGNPNKQQVISVLRHLGRIILALDLLDGGINGLVVFQFYDDGGRIHILSRDEDKVGKQMARVARLVVIGVQYIDLRKLRKYAKISALYYRRNKITSYICSREKCVNTQKKSTIMEIKRDYYLQKLFYRIQCKVPFEGCHY